MVFIALGTHGRPIDRAVDWVVTAIDAGLISGPVTVQCAIRGRRSDVLWKPIIPEAQFLTLMESSDVLITHEGPGTILRALELGRVPVVVPRERRYGEHVDNHQVEFARVLTKYGIPVARTYEEFSTAVQHVHNADVPKILAEISVGMEPLQNLLSRVRDRV